MIGTCESCGRDDELIVVRRMYVTPEAWDTPEKVVVAGEELWCFVCRTHYPHQLPEEGGALESGRDQRVGDGGAGVG